MELDAADQFPRPSRLKCFGECSLGVRVEVVADQDYLRTLRIVLSPAENDDAFRMKVAALMSALSRYPEVRSDMENRKRLVSRSWSQFEFISGVREVQAGSTHPIHPNSPKPTFYSRSTDCHHG
mgnify:CR=1 FL=1